MLDREKLAKDIFSIVSKLFPDLTNENELARKKWAEICKDVSFEHRSQVAQSSFLVPKWDGKLSDVFEISDKTNEYCVIAIDGSQIYPDRHIAGAGCFLINTGGVVLSYGKESFVKLFSHPNVLLPQDIMQNTKSIHFSRDLVDLKREEYELEKTVEKAIELKDNNPICFIDGTIIFWQLEGKSPEVRRYFLEKYLNYLDALYQNKILFAGYISMPKSKELVSLIKLGLCRFSIADCIKCHSRFETFPCKQVDHLVDTQVARFLKLSEKARPCEKKKFSRTTVFYSTSKIVEFYPEDLKPAFVYCDVGSEIIRLEVPKYIAACKESLDRVCSIALDQSLKGQGYPVCLAEAHEQAVVKGADRDFFYHLLCKIGIDHNKKLKLSPKATKKRRIGV